LVAKILLEKIGGKKQNFWFKKNKNIGQKKIGGKKVNFFVKNVNIWCKKIGVKRILV